MTNGRNLHNILVTPVVIEDSMDRQCTISCYCKGRECDTWYQEISKKNPYPMRGPIFSVGGRDTGALIFFFSIVLYSYSYRTSCSDSTGGRRTSSVMVTASCFRPQFSQLYWTRQTNTSDREAV